MERILNYRPKYFANIEAKPCSHRFIYERGNGRKTAYLHYVDGMEIWELCPDMWDGWKLMHRIIGEKEVY